MWKGLIASDVDGTLLPYGERVLSEALFPVIREAKARGILFAAASGREYSSLLQLFEPVKDDIYFISTNGGQIVYRGEVLMEHHFSEQLVEAFVTDVFRQDSNIDVLISTPTRSFVRKGRDSFFDLVRAYGNEVVAIDAVSEIDEPVIKLALWCPDGAIEQYPHFSEAWGEQIQIAVSGPFWLDFNVTDKGHALAHLADLLGLTPERVAAFGDQYNDVAMLDYAGHPYLMAHAGRDLLERGYPTSSDVTGDIIRTLDLFDPV